MLLRIAPKKTFYNRCKKTHEFVFWFVDQQVKNLTYFKKEYRQKQAGFIFGFCPFKGSFKGPFKRVL